MRVEFPAVSRREQLGLWVERFFRLFSRNQWKRERYAPSFHVDDENLDPKTWCRFPILSGGYERELAELRSRGRERAVSANTRVHRSRADVVAFAFDGRGAARSVDPAWARPVRGEVGAARRLRGARARAWSGPPRASSRKRRASPA